jgi:molybdopterin adenylyltransferase
MSIRNYMNLEIPSKSQNEAFARVVVAAFASQLDPTIEELADVKTAVSEAVTNAIIHGYDNNEGIVTIRCRLTEDGIEVEVSDSGKGIEDIEKIKEAIIRMADEEKLDLILTTGGTGFSPRDVTPEATLSVVERVVPGIPEAMRLAGLQSTPLAMLSRAVAGIRNGSLIINLPGSPKGVKENLEAILPAITHGLQILQGKSTECGSSH